MLFRSPHHQATVRSLWQVSSDWQLDSALRYVDRVESTSNKDGVDSYITLDLRIAWQAYEMMTLSLVGQNLLGKHREFRGSTVETQATDVEPSLFFQVDLQI